VEANWLEGERLDADYWARNLRQPVQFARAISVALAEKHRLFLEVGPHPLLSADIEQGLSQHHEQGWVLPSLRREMDARRCLLQSLSELYLRGCRVDFEALHPQGGRVVPLPGYPWQRQRYWVQSEGRTAPPSVPEVPDDWYYEVAWVEPAAALRAVPPLPKGQHILILADRGGVGTKLAAALTAAGMTTRLLFADHASELPLELAKHLQLGFQHLVHLFTLDLPSIDGLSGQELVSADERLGCGSVLRCLPQLAAAEAGDERRGRRPRLWLVTRGAVPAEGRGGALFGAPLWGLGRVLAQEHPELWGGLLDLDPAPAHEEAMVRQLASTFLAAELDEEDQVALRGDKRLCARMARSLPPPPATFVLRGDVTYLVTGGLGNLGLQLARWLIERGARHLLLISRTPLEDPSSSRRRAVEALRALGAEVRVQSLDVADAEALRTALATLSRPLAGILHAAGDGNFQPLLGPSSPAALLAAFRAKVAGAWHLHQLTRALALDFFVMFSSAAAVLGGRTQGHYAAANQFLDALVYARRAQGLTATSINWGLWADGGIGGAALAQKLSAGGLRPMATETALAALERIVADDRPQQLVAAIDWSCFRAVYETRARRQLLAELGEERRPESHAQPRLRQQLAAASFIEAQRLLLDFISRQVRRVLGFSKNSELRADRGFFELGMDSTLAAQLMTALGEALGERLPTMLVFEHPSIARLSSCLVHKLGITPAGGAATKSRPQSTVAAHLLDDSDAEEELATKLAAKLAKPL